jgi:hypothetical protein
MSSSKQTRRGGPEGHGGRATTLRRTCYLPPPAPSGLAPDKSANAPLRTAAPPPAVPARDRQAENGLPRFAVAPPERADHDVAVGRERGFPWRHVAPAVTTLASIVVLALWATGSFGSSSNSEDVVPGGIRPSVTVPTVPADSAATTTATGRAAAHHRAAATKRRAAARRRTQPPAAPPVSAPIPASAATVPTTTVPTNTAPTTVPTTTPTSPPVVTSPPVATSPPPKTTAPTNTGPDDASTKPSEPSSQPGRESPKP